MNCLEGLIAIPKLSIYWFPLGPLYSGSCHFVTQNTLCSAFTFCGKPLSFHAGITLLLQSYLIFFLFHGFHIVSVPSGTIFIIFKCYSLFRSLSDPSNYLSTYMLIFHPSIILLTIFPWCLAFVVGGKCWGEAVFACIIWQQQCFPRSYSRLSHSLWVVPLELLPNEALNLNQYFYKMLCSLSCMSFKRQENRNWQLGDVT